MRSQKNVSFNLAPIVHLYKKRICSSVAVATNDFFCPTPRAEDEVVVKAESCQQQNIDNDLPPEPYIPQPPPPLSSIFGPNWWLSKNEISEPETLTISVPFSSCGISPNNSPAPDYDMSPLSPNTHTEMTVQRIREIAERKSALEEALHDFNNSVTPHSQRTPASVIVSRSSPLSPFSLSAPTSPNPVFSLLPPLPMSTNNSVSDLASMETKMG